MCAKTEFYKLRLFPYASSRVGGFGFYVKIYPYYIQFLRSKSLRPDQTTRNCVS